MAVALYFRMEDPFHPRIPMPPLYRAFIGLALRRPHLIPALVGTAWAFRRRRWWAHAPFLPIPPSDYLRWRMDTAYGDAEAEPPRDDLARFVRWAAAMRRGT